METVSQATSTVKPIAVDLPYAWGFEDGAQGKSFYTGYDYFAGEKLVSYKTGWHAGRNAKRRQQPSH